MDEDSVLLETGWEIRHFKVFYKKINHVGRHHFLIIVFDFDKWTKALHHEDLDRVSYR